MKTYKGMELVKAVANYELKGGTKLECIYYPTYGQGIEVDEREQRLIWSDTKEPINYCHFNDSDFEFKIKKEKEEKEIPAHILNQTIQQMENNDCKCIAHKVNEFIDYLKYIKEDKIENK